MSEARTLHHDGYRAMPPEPWGRKLKRARWDLNRFTLDDAVRLVGQFMLTSGGSISRLEDLDEMPSGGRSASRRQLAYILCLCCQVDPAEFGLSSDDLPPGLTIPARTLNDQGEPASTKWSSEIPSVRALRPAA